MARPQKHNWADIRKHYEAGMSQKEIVDKLKCPKSSLSERIKAEGWQINELAKDAIANSVSVYEQINELYEQDSRLAQVAIDITRDKTKYLLLFQDATIRNQLLANNAIDDKSKIFELNAHSQLTQRNKETVLGKDKTTEISQTQQTEVKSISVTYE